MLRTCLRCGEYKERSEFPSQGRGEIKALCRPWFNWTRYMRRVRGRGYCDVDRCVRVALPEDELCHVHRMEIINAPARMERERVRMEREHKRALRRERNEAIVAMYARLGASTHDRSMQGIADVFGVSIGTVWAILHANGADIRPRGRPRSGSWRQNPRQNPRPVGLGWDDIDDGMVTVTSQLQRLDGAWVRTPTKAKRSLRRIAIDPDTVAAFERHRRRMAEERTPDWPYYGLVFTTQRGMPMHGRWVKHELDAAFRRAKVRQRRFHDLRHTHQTMLVDIGVDEAGRMARAGHSTVAASRRYGKASESQDRLAADAVGARLRG